MKLNQEQIVPAAAAVVAVTAVAVAVAAADAVVTAAAVVVATMIASNENHAGNFVGAALRGRPSSLEHFNLILQESNWSSKFKGGTSGRPYFFISFTTKACQNQYRVIATELC
jgi:hypothetical protein